MLDLSHLPTDCCWIIELRLSTLLSATLLAEDENKMADLFTEGRQNFFFDLLLELHVLLDNLLLGAIIKSSSSSENIKLLPFLLWQVSDGHCVSLSVVFIFKLLLLELELWTKKAIHYV